MTISVDLTDAEQKQLAEIAAQLDVSVEELAEVAIRDLLSEHGGMQIGPWRVLRVPPAPPKGVTGFRFVLDTEAHG